MIVLSGVMDCTGKDEVARRVRVKVHRRAIELVGVDERSEPRRGRPRDREVIELAECRLRVANRLDAIGRRTSRANDHAGDAEDADETAKGPHVQPIGVTDISIYTAFCQPVSDLKGLGRSTPTVRSGQFAER